MSEEKRRREIPGRTAPAPQRPAKPVSEQLPPELARAKALIQQKRFDDARAILITVDHPLADKWLERLSSIAPSKSHQQFDTRPMPSFTLQLVITIVLLFVMLLPGLIALHIFSDEAKKYPDAPGARGLILLRRWAFWLILLSVLLIIGLAVVLMLTVTVDPNTITSQF